MGKGFLARAGGSQNQHRRVQLGVASHLLLEAAHGCAFAQNAAQAVLRGQAGLDPAFVLIEGVPQVVDLGGELFQLFGIVENGLGDHARQPPLAVAHRNAVDHHGQGVAGPELAEFAHFGPAVAQHHARARVGDDFSDVASQQFFGPPAQQIGIGLVHEADDVVHVAEQHAHGQAVQNEGGHFAVFVNRGHGKLLDRAAPRNDLVLYRREGVEASSAPAGARASFSLNHARPWCIVPYLHALVVRIRRPLPSRIGILDRRT